jgi:hypothetical protein
VILPDDPHKKGREDANMLSDQKKIPDCLGLWADEQFLRPLARSRRNRGTK